MPTKNYIELITTNAKDFPPCILHRAIAFYGPNGRKMVMHNTTNANVELLDYGRFMLGRKIYAKRTCPLRRPFDPCAILKAYNKPFDWIENNCEDFTTYVVNNYTTIHLHQSSPQRNFWTILTAILYLLLILSKNNA